MLGPGFGPACPIHAVRITIFHVLAPLIPDVSRGETMRFPVLALSNRAEFRARHGLDISSRLFLADRLSFHATGDLQDRGYASLDYASVSREAAAQYSLRHSGDSLQVILVIVNARE
jgi:hypothetical protein